MSSKIISILAALGLITDADKAQRVIAALESGTADTPAASIASVATFPTPRKRVADTIRAARTGRTSYALTGMAKQIASGRVKTTLRIIGNNAAVLSALAKSGQPLTNAELADASGVSPKSTESSVYQLRQMGLIESIAAGPAVAETTVADILTPKAPKGRKAAKGGRRSRKS